MKFVVIGGLFCVCICIELYVQCVLKLLITDVEKHGICYS